MDTTRSAADEATAAAAKADKAALKAAAAQRKLVKGRIQKFALLVFEKKDKGNKHQWHPLHGSDKPGVPEGRFEGLVAIFDRLLIGDVNNDSFTQAVTPLTEGKGLRSRSS
jgi:hypothetical protein